MRYFVVMIKEALRTFPAMLLATVSLETLLIVPLLTACSGPHLEQRTESYTVEVTGAGALQMPLPTLDAAARARFDLGKAEFERRWAPYPSIGGQWGRGPLASADSCAACHPRNGRGALPATASIPDQTADAEPPRGVLLRLGMPDPATPDPRYGRQFDTEGLLGRVPAEGQLRIVWHKRRVLLDDGEAVMLRRPEARVELLAYGPLDAATKTSLRVAPPLIGLGLLESVEARTLDALRTRQRDAGIDGQINRVWDVARAITAPGRFGWKAAQPSLRQQSAAAFLDDIGVTTTLYPREDCTAAQDACRSTETVPHPELKPMQLALLTFYLRNLAVPAPRAQDAQGERLFRELGCALCHAQTLRTTRTEAPNIHPYTDLMLHDMGQGLADELSEYEAQGRHWRTPPLWGLGLATPTRDGLRLLHDGRARDVQEAILWHDGEAAPMRAAYARLPRAERVILLAFLQSL